jgi:hypothetical protein
MYWKNKLHLRWKPAIEGKKERPNGSLHGVYEAFVVTEDGSQVVCEVAPDWVQYNIDEEARELLHVVHKDWHKKYVDGKGRLESGYLSLQGHDDNKSDFKLDNRQISAVRYLPRREVKTTHAEIKVMEEKWRGIIKGVNGASDEFVDLDQEWMDANVSKNMQGFIKTTRNAGTEGYVRIPEGAAADHSQAMLSMTTHPEAPKLRYRRDVHAATDRTCVLKGAASCLWYLGYKRLASILCNDVISGNKMDNGFAFFQQVMDSKKLEKKERRAFQFMRLKSHPQHWDILEDSKKYLMCLVGLIGDDAKTDHAVAIAGNWIFDSNLEHALPLCKESLDLCCSDNNHKNQCVGVSRVVMLKSINK